jgi:hypothetical protein
MHNQANPASIVKVGGGRGFIVEHRVKLPPGRHHLRKFVTHRLVVTAAHCLPKLPPATSAAFTYEKTYKGLLGKLGARKSDVSTECLFADPVADIAVLGCPDNQALFDEANAYDELVEGAPALRIGNARSGRGWLLALSGKRWLQTTLSIFNGTFLETGPTEPGMSGSPILNDAGKAVGVVSIGGETTTEGIRENHRAGPQPILSRNLPAWMLSE